MVPFSRPALRKSTQAFLLLCDARDECNDDAVTHLGKTYDKNRWAPRVKDSVSLSTHGSHQARNPYSLCRHQSGSSLSRYGSSLRRVFEPFLETLVRVEACTRT